MKDKIEFKEFLEIEEKLEIMVGEVISVEDVLKSNKLIKLNVKFGEELRIVVTNIKPLLSDIKLLEGEKFLFITNLKPVIMMGIESTAMILPGEIKNDKIVTIKTSNSGVKVL